MQQGQPQQGDSGQSLPTDIMMGLQTMGQALQEAGAPQEILQQLMQVIELYDGVLQALSGGGGSPNQPRPEQVNTQGAVASPAGPM